MANEVIWSLDVDAARGYHDEIEVLVGGRYLVSMRCTVGNSQCMIRVELLDGDLNDLLLVKHMGHALGCRKNEQVKGKGDDQ